MYYRKWILVKILHENAILYIIFLFRDLPKMGGDKIGYGHRLFWQNARERIMEEKGKVMMRKGKRFLGLLLAFFMTVGGMEAMTIFCGESIVYAEPTQGTDETAPVITGLSFVESSIQAPGTAKLKIDFTEEGLGLESVNVTLAYKDEDIEYSPDVNKYANAIVQQNSETTGSITVDIPIDENELSGTWTIYHLQITDHGGNMAGVDARGKTDEAGNFSVGYVDPNNKPVNFNVPDIEISSNNTDGKAPKVTGLSFVEETMEAPGTAQLKIDFVEEESGLKEVSLSLTYKAEDMGYVLDENKYIYLLGKEGNSQKTGSIIVDIPVGADVLSGTWTIYNLSLSDNGGNVLSISERVEHDEEGNYYSALYDGNDKMDISNPEIVIHSGNNDATAPRITGIQMEQKTVFRPGIAPVTIHFVEEESGIKSAQIGLVYKENDIGYHSDDNKYVYGYFNADDSFRGDSITIEVPISSNLKLGTWTIYSLALTDRMGNVAQLGARSAYDEEGNHSVALYLGDERVDLAVPEFVIADEFNFDFEVCVPINFKLFFRPILFLYVQ